MKLSETGKKENKKALPNWERPFLSLFNPKIKLAFYQYKGEAMSIENQIRTSEKVVF
jgi:hypothetical protein